MAKRKGAATTIERGGKSAKLGTPEAEEVVREAVRDVLEPVAILPKCAAAVALGCAPSPGRFAMHCISIETSGGVAILRATDRRLLIVARYPHLETTPGFSALVPGCELADAIKFGKLNDEDGARLTAKDGRAILAMPRGDVAFPLGAGQFPNFDDIIPAHDKAPGLKPGAAVGMGFEVVPRAIQLAARSVGQTDGGATVWPGGDRAPWRFDVKGPAGSATVCWMPFAIAEAESAPVEVVAASGK